MVRALPFDSETRVNPGRVMAIFTAIAVHVAALLMLLVPLASVPPDITPRPDKPTIRFYTRPLPPPVVPVAPATPRPVQPVTVERTQAATPKPPAITVNPAVSPVFDARAIDLPAQDPVADAGPEAPVSSGPIAAGQLQYVSAPAPGYPRDALRDHAQGTVMLRVLVDSDGTPLEVSIETSSGNRSLDRKAQQQVLKHWRFKPAFSNGQAVQSYGLVPIQFSLQ
ncbi:energy transducer TonB [Pseudoxanthomonas dokdonensis]|uniref:TonB C-terminal domain-containing protein n=1 Tax=Pseudoxanthomonas dokdonensis TaxID=344882 RepID=A0A0R0CHM1_9GAMM|nr:energy transducer TonB [Pseudoxanthomonas dokdonensis]KRG69061.1 hypothetical protein ABB29_11545 [Pseudoxanthomonas dokdonensis]